MPVSEKRFRHVLGHLASGVSVVTSLGPDGRPCGLTATSVCSVSLEPPLVLVCIDRETHTYRGIESSDVYAVNLLTGEQAELAVHFAEAGFDKFADVAHHAEVTGAPVLDRALGYCDCEVVRAVPAGDHTVYVGRVVDAAVLADEDVPTLLYHRGAYGTTAPGSVSP